MRVLPEHLAASDRVADGDGLRAHLISRELCNDFFFFFAKYMYVYISFYNAPANMRRTKDS